MEEKSANKKISKIKGFLKSMIEEIDKKMQEKAKSKSCCCKPADKEKKSCCS